MPELSQADRPLWGLREVVVVAAPASLSMLTRTLMRFVDGYMVSTIGPDQLSSQLVAGMAAFAFEAFILGTLTAVNTFVSQNRGAGRDLRCGEFARSGMLLAMALSALAMPMLLLGERFFGLLNQPPELLGLEVMYFRYMILSIPLSQLAVALGRFFFGIHRSHVVLLGALAGNGFNILANWVLIFGHWGFPAMGLEGAAIGTIMGVGVEFVVMLAFFVSPAVNRRFGTVRLQASWRQIRQVLRVGWPAGLQFFSDLVSWAVLTSILIGGFGRAHLAAHTAIIRYISLSFMPAVGIGIAATALVGKYIGAGRRDLARKRAHAALLLAMGYMGTCGLAFLLFRGPLVDVFVTAQDTPGLSGEAIVEIGSQLFIVAALFQLFDAIGIVYVGALRGAGDTRFTMVVTMLLSWTVVVGGGLTMVHWLPGLKSLGPWIAGAAYVIILGLVLAWRFEGGAWERIELLDREGPLPPGSQPALALPGEQDA